MNETTIAEVKRTGATGIECRCLDPKCRHWVGLYFSIIRKARPDLDLDRLMLRKLAARMKCSRELDWKSDRQSDAQGCARTYWARQSSKPRRMFEALF